MLRILIFLGVVLLLFAPLNLIAIRQLLRIHPRRRRWIIAAAVLGNLMWPFFFVMRQSNDFARFTRAVFGPPWFTWLCFVLLYAGLLFLVLLAWIPFRRRRTLAEFARWPSRVFIALGIIGSIVGIYQALVPLRIERVPIAIRGLPAHVEGTRIAILSDLHVGLFTRPSRLIRIFERTAQLQPHVVLLTGDMIDDDPYFVPKLLEGTRPLPPQIPLLGVLGNHEIYGDPHAVIAKMRGSRIRLLVNEGFAANGVWFAGIADYAGSQVPNAPRPDFTKALNGKPAEMVPVVVSHQPLAFADAKKHGLPLTLCGHSHGGQCGIRPLGWSLAGVFIPYHMGRYEEGGMQLYVNTGTGYWLVPFRLGMTPEITLIELRRGLPQPSPRS